MQVAILPAEQGTRSTDNAVAAGVVLPSIAVKRVGPTACVVRCSGDSGSRACDAYADQCPPRMSTCNTRTAHGSERATGPRLSALDRQRDAALLRPAEGQYCCACEGRGHNGKLSKTSLFHGVPPKVAPVDVYYLLRVCSRARSKNPRPNAQSWHPRAGSLLCYLQALLEAASHVVGLVLAADGGFLAS
jgi:hypothetical protein